MNYNQPQPNYPQQYQPYPQYPQGNYYQPQPEVVYEESRSRWNDPNTSWLMSLLALCCGCFLGDMFCDQPCLVCCIPCSLPRFGRRY